MKRSASLAAVALLVSLCALSLAAFADTAESKMVGVITRIEISGKDATTATVTLKDNKTEQLVVVTINDELTLDKLKDHRIVEGDEIRCKYEIVDGKNVSTYFRKTAGC
jgi:hypothetical protein